MPSLMYLADYTRELSSLAPSEADRIIELETRYLKVKVEFEHAMIMLKKARQLLLDRDVLPPFTLSEEA